MGLRLSLACAALLVSGACGGSSSPVGTDGSSLDRATTTAGGQTRGDLVKTAPGPVGLAVDTRGRVWVANADAGTVSRLSAGGTRVDLTTAVGAAPLRLAMAGGAVWVTVFTDGTLVRLDSRTGKVTKTIRVGSEPEGVTAAFGSLWVVLQVSAELVRVDPQSGKIVHRYRVGEAPRLVEAGAGALWVSDFASGRIISVDPVSGDIRRSARLCDGPQGMLVEAETVWVACTSSDLLVGVDRRTLAKTSDTPLPDAPDAIGAGQHGRLLVALQKGPTLAVFDPSSRTVLRRERLGTVDQLYDRANIDLVLIGGTAYVSSYLEGGVYRVKP
jgi:streptogramin lyase